MKREREARTGHLAARGVVWLTVGGGGRGGAWGGRGADQTPGSSYVRYVAREGRQVLPKLVVLHAGCG